MLPIDVAIALKQGTSVCLEIIERLGDIHQRISGQSAFKIQHAA